MSDFKPKIWMVPLSLEHEINLERGSKPNEYISALSDPLLNSYNK